ncbi:Uncharacterized protein dnm_051960 [Desulfonema magnum]|uniref:Uncharacterized protein n=1 Tax=Desulfonema magnum TaxID=45655 RepID=A0A975BPP0_9BACT|nr:Uncharacterized protein dnm_051960 [Desulfonema magnum]
MFQQIEIVEKYKFGYGNKETKFSKKNLVSYPKKSYCKIYVRVLI